MFLGRSSLPIPMALEKQLESNAGHLQFPETLRSALMPGGRPFGKSNGVQKALLVSSFFCENVFPTIGWCLCQLRLNLGAFIKDPNQRSGEKREGCYSVTKGSSEMESTARIWGSLRLPVHCSEPSWWLNSLSRGNDRDSKGNHETEGMGFCAGRPYILGRAPSSVCGFGFSRTSLQKARAFANWQRESLLFSKVRAWGDAKAAG